jgi:hypothetical protein
MSSFFLKEERKGGKEEGRERGRGKGRKEMKKLSLVVLSLKSLVRQFSKCSPSYEIPAVRNEQKIGAEDFTCLLFAC